MAAMSRTVEDDSPPRADPQVPTAQGPSEGDNGQSGPAVAFPDDFGLEFLDDLPGLLGQPGRPLQPTNHESHNIITRSPEDANKRLGAMFGTMKGLGAGYTVGVLPHSLKKSIEKAAKDPSYGLTAPPSVLYGESLLRGMYGGAPQILDVSHLVQAAKVCETSAAPHGVWNTTVYYPLVQLSLKSIHDKPVKLLFAIPSDHAGYNDKPGAYGGIVDICVAFDPVHSRLSENEDVGAIIDDVRARGQPASSINQTDFSPLQRCPIGLSIVTKTHHHHDRGANMEIAVWQHEQWKWLRTLVSRCGQDLQWTEEVFFPALLVEGHDWYFAASKPDDADPEFTAYYSKVYIGSTETHYGVYKIVYAIQVIGHYLTKVYWPWFKEFVLNMPPISLMLGKNVYYHVPYSHNGDVFRRSYKLPCMHARPGSPLHRKPRTPGPVSFNYPVVVDSVEASPPCGMVEVDEEEEARRQQRRMSVSTCSSLPDLEGSDSETVRCASASGSGDYEDEDED